MRGNCDWLHTSGGVACFHSLVSRWCVFLPCFISVEGIDDGCLGRWTGIGVITEASFVGIFYCCVSFFSFVYHIPFS